MAEEEVVGTASDYFFVGLKKKKLEMRPAGWSSADTADWRETKGTKNSWTQLQKTSTSSMASS